MTATGTVIPPLHKDIGSFGLFHYRSFFAFGHNTLCVPGVRRKLPLFRVLDTRLLIARCLPSVVLASDVLSLSFRHGLRCWEDQRGKVGQPTYAHLRSVLPCLPILAVERGCGSSNPTCTIQTLAECLLGGLTQADL